MQRHESLQDLSRDHYFALVQAQQIRKAVAGEKGAMSVEDAARDVLRFYDEEGRHHFDEEEQVVLPILGRQVDLDRDKLVQGLLQDHEWLRDAFRRLRRLVEGENDPKKPLAELGRRLNDHARLEEDELFPRLQAELDTVQLGQIHEASKEFRRRTRGGASIGRHRHQRKLAHRPS